MSVTTAGLVQLGVLLVLLAAVYVPFGNHLARVYTDGRHWRVERAVYRAVGVDPDAERGAVGNGFTAASEGIEIHGRGP